MSRVTLAEVAKEAGVSLSTASVAFSGSGPISDATKAKVLAAAESLGYQGPHPLAASLRRGRSGVIAVIAPANLRYSFRDPVSIQILDGASEALGASGYGMLLIPSLDPLGETNPLLQTASFDAAINFTVDTRHAAIHSALQTRSIPMVTVGSSAAPGIRVVSDERAGMRRLAHYLLEQGYDRLGIASLPWTAPDRSGWVAEPATTAPILSMTHNRYEGLTGASLPGGSQDPAPDLSPIHYPAQAVWECSRSMVDEGITAGHALLAAGARTLVGFSDLIAAGLLIAAQEEGRKIPEEVVVAGFDGLDLPWLGHHRLTTVRQPMIRKGQLAAQAAINLAEGEEAHNIILETELVVGTTT